MPPPPPTSPPPTPNPLDRTPQRVWETVFCGRPCIVKQRFSKKYRHPALDAKLTLTRLKQEARSLLRARKAGVPTPAMYFIESETSSIYMERVEGRSVRHLLQDGLLDAAGGRGAAAEVTAGWRAPVGSRRCAVCTG